MVTSHELYIQSGEKQQKQKSCWISEQNTVVEGKNTVYDCKSLDGLNEIIQN